MNETAAIVLEAKRSGGKSGALIAGGGSPKNFLLQTEPQIQEVLGIDERGHDYFLQLTDARPDTGGLSGATPGEAVSWGKIDPDMLPGTVVCYMDNTVSLPLLTAYALARHAPRPLKRLYGRREAMMARLIEEYQAALDFRDQPHRGGARRHVTKPPVMTRAYANYALGLLTLINVVNYMERNVIFALFEPIKRDLQLTDSHLGWLGAAYVLVFSIAALPVGVLSDLHSRTGMTAFGVALWSAFTSLGGLVRNFTQLLVCRAAVGLGGAAANAAGTALVADFFSGPARALAMSIFTAGLALGGVLGILAAGQLEAIYGWRVAFLALGLPGIRTRAAGLPAPRSAALERAPADRR